MQKKIVEKNLQLQVTNTDAQNITIKYGKYVKMLNATKQLQLETSDQRSIPINTEQIYYSNIYNRKYQKQRECNIL